MTMKPQSSVFSIETAATHRQTSTDGRSTVSTKAISIINQPLPEIPKHQSNPEQVLCASNLNNYRSLQRPQPSNTKSSSRSTGRVVMPPILPPKNRQQYNRSQQPLPQKSQFIGYQQQQLQQYPSRERDRDRSRSGGRHHDDNYQNRSSSKQSQQQQPQQNFQTLPHHHHYPPSSMNIMKNNRKSDSQHDGRGSYSSKSLQRGSREMSHHPFENYSATEL